MNERQTSLAEEATKYLESHPELLEQLRQAESVYRIFGEYLSLTQSQTIIRESGGCNTEVDANATVSLTDC